MPQNDAYVDLSYRGLSLGRRIKLTQVRPSTGYLEHPTPMPVGTPVSINTDDGLTIDAVVTHVHEQVGGSDRAPGMIVKPAFSDTTLAWWSALVSLPDSDTAEAETRPRIPGRAQPVTVRPRTHTAPNPVGQVVEATPPETSMPVTRIELVPTQPTGQVPSPQGAGDGKRTVVMDAVDQEMLERLSRDSSGEIERIVRTTGEHPIVDDGQRTTLMDAIDPAALGLEVSASGSMPAMSAEAGEVDDDDADDDSQPIAVSSGDQKAPAVKKRRRKRR